MPYAPTEAEAVIRQSLTQQYGDDNPSRVARNVLHALRAAGLKVVPTEPTSGMCEAGEEAYTSGYTGTPTASPDAVWRKMVEAAR